MDSVITDQEELETIILLAYIIQKFRYSSQSNIKIIVFSSIAIQSAQFILTLMRFVIKTKTIFNPFQIFKCTKTLYASSYCSVLLSLYT